MGIKQMLVNFQIISGRNRSGFIITIGEEKRKHKLVGLEGLL